MIKNITLTWETKELHFKLNGVRYYSGPAHFFRMFLVLFFLTLSSFYIASLFKDKSVQILFKSGSAICQNSDGKLEEIKIEKEYSERRLFIVGSKLDLPASYSQINRQALAEKLQESSLVLRYPTKETIIISNGSKIQKETDSNSTILSYKVKGIINFIFPKSEKRQQIKINDFSFTTQGGHFFYSDVKTEKTLILIRGDFKSPSFSLDKQGIVKASNIKSEQITNFPTELYISSWMAGFEQNKLNPHIGFILLRKEGVTLIRNKKEYLLRGIRTPIMLGDEFKAEQGKGLIQLKAQDLIKLYPESSIAIKQYEGIKEGSSLFERLANLEIGSLKNNLLRNKNELVRKFQYAKSQLEKQEVVENVLLVTTETQDGKTKKLISNFSFKGKIRLKVKSKRKRKVAFRSLQAVVTVRGTEFETSSQKNMTEVLGVSGKVALTDPKARGESEITFGMMSSVQKDQLPTKPVPIPPERLKELLKEGFSDFDGPRLAPGQSLDQVFLKRNYDFPVHWQDKIAKADLRMSNKLIPLKIAGDNKTALINRDQFIIFELGEYPALVIAENFEGKRTEIPVNIITHDLCNGLNFGFTEKDKITIKKFQKKHNIKIDGIIGPETRTTMKRVLNCKK